MSAETAAARREVRLGPITPFSVLVFVYVVYFGVTYSRLYRYAYWSLMNLGTRIIGFVPSPQTLALYAYGAAALVCGFLGGVLLAGRAAEGAPLARLADLARRLVRRLDGLPLARRFGALFVLCLLGWSVGLMANVQQVAASGGASLLNISTRWGQSAVVVWFAASQIFFVPALFVSARTNRQRWLAAGLFVVSVLALGLLGARNLPAKLVVSTFLALVYVVRPRDLWRLAAVFAVLLVAAMAVIGSLSKAGIYSTKADAGLVLGLTYSDSVGTSYNLDRIVRLTPSTGLYKGRLARDSFLSLIPGVDAEYANFQLGRYLGGRRGFLIGGQTIERSVSLAPTLLGAPYADSGALGVATQMVGLGLLFGYLQTRARRALWLVPFLVTFASYAINGVNAGVHNPHAIAATMAALAVTVTDAMVGDGSPGPGSEETA